MIVPVILVMNDDYFLPYTLASIQGFFDRYVIYNVGSTDNTGNIIDWFVEQEKKRATFYVRHLPFVEPQIQGIFRNSMIAEAQSDWYMIVDGDEVYKPESIHNIFDKMTNLKMEHKIYGVVRRMEIANSLTQRYNQLRSHHRVYHRTAIWKGNHPGEEAVTPQKPFTEYWIEDSVCYHFHGALRTSDKESVVPKRLDRKEKATYKPGDLIPIDLLEEVPILRKPIESFPVSPVLEKLQREWSS